MTHRPPRRLAWSLPLIALGLIAAGLALPGSLASATAQTGAQAGPTSIAVVNLQKILEQLTEFTNEKARLETENKARQAELDNITRELQDLASRLEAMAKDDPARKATEAAAQGKQIEGRARQQDLTAEVELASGRAMWSLYAKINDVVARYALQQGYDLVLVYDEIQPPPASRQTRSIVQKISQDRQVMFASPRVDISDQIIVMMNNDYAASGGKAAPAAGGAASPAANRTPVGAPKAQPKGKK
jgi:Skp family chaperone for outer membrane proteins